MNVLNIRFRSYPDVKGALTNIREDGSRISANTSLAIRSLATSANSVIRERTLDHAAFWKSHGDPGALPDLAGNV